MNQNDRWCVRVHKEFGEKVIYQLILLGYRVQYGARNYTGWLYWNCDAVRSSEWKPIIGLVESFKELHPCEIFDGTLEPYKVDNIYERTATNKRCSTCKHFDVHQREYPCCDCECVNLWEPKETAAPCSTLEERVNRLEACVMELKNKIGETK
jgi:hypothetical protein